MKSKQQSSSPEDGGNLSSTPPEIETQVEDIYSKVLELLPSSITNESEDDGSDYQEKLKEYMEKLKTTIKSNTIQQSIDSTSG